jgi:hypothetical protein
MLTTIDKCLIYAVKYKRTLIIITHKKGWFKDDIHNYIGFEHPNIYVGDIDTILEKIEDLSIYPDTMKGRLLNPAFILSKNINIKKQYDEDVLVSFSLGGGICREIIKCMRFKSNVLDIYKSRIAKMPKDYIGIHIRNTDKKSDIPAFIAKHSNIFIPQNSDIQLEGAIFLASDDIKLLNDFKTKYKNIYTFSNIPLRKKGEENIHKYSHDMEHSMFIIDCLVDLLMLASGKEYFYSTKYTNTYVPSGYSKLAEIMFNNKNILHNMIGCIDKMDENKLFLAEKKQILHTRSNIDFSKLSKKRI